MSATVIFPDRYVIEASETELGLVAVDTSNGLTISDGVIGVSAATTSRLGTVRPDGTTITVDQDGTIHGATQGDMEVKIDNDTIKKNSSGELYATVKIDNNTIKRNATGQLYADVSGTSEVKVDNSTIKINANGEIYVALQNAANVSF